MRAPERPNPSPLSSATVAIGAARYLLRRYRVGPVLVILAAAILVIGAMRNANTTTGSVLSRWQATVEVWTTTGPVGAGKTIESGAVRSILVPADLVPVGDLVDLHHAVDGRRIAADAIVVMASDADLGVAVPAEVVGDVVRASGQAGVVPVLSG